MGLVIHKEVTGNVSESKSVSKYALESIGECMSKEECKSIVSGFCFFWLVVL